MTIVNKKAMLSLFFTLLVIATSFSGCTSSQPTNSGDQFVASSRIVPAEQPESSQRVQSSKAHLTPTKVNPWGVAVDEARGFVWVAEPGCEMTPTCSGTFASYIGKYALADGSMIADYPQPAMGPVGTKYSSPLFVAVNPKDGHIWFTEPNSNAIGELSQDDGTWGNYAKGITPGSAPYDLVFDKNGNIWFTEINGNAIGFLDTKNHKIVETATPTLGSNPYGITRDELCE